MNELKFLVIRDPCNCNFTQHKNLSKKMNKRAGFSSTGGCALGSLYKFTFKMQHCTACCINLSFLGTPDLFTGEWGGCHHLSSFDKRMNLCALRMVLRMAALLFLGWELGVLPALY